jgi:hypothetical protein
MREGEFFASQEHSDNKHRLEGLTFRSILLSIMILTSVVYFCNFVSYSGAIVGIGAGSEISHVALVFPLLVMIVNSLIGRKLVKPLLNSREILVMYIIVAVGAFAGTTGIAKPVLYAMFGIQAVNLLYPRTGDVPIIEALSDLAFPKGEEAALGFTLGGMKVPWGELVIPTILWSVFAFALFAVFLSVANLFRHRWTETERLTYPIAIPIMKILETNKEGGLGGIWRDKLMYIGFLVPLVFNGLPVLQKYFSVVPVVPTVFDFAVYAPEGAIRDALADYPYFKFYIMPTAFALSYFAPLDFLLSFTVSYVFLHKGLLIILRVLGNPQQIGIDFQAYHLTGAMVGFAGSLVWLAKTDLAVTFRTALGKQGYDLSDADNRGMSARVSVITLLAASAVIWFFLAYFVNVNPVIAILWLIIYIAIALAGVRVRAESGVPVQSGVQLHPSLTRIMVKTTGGQILDPRTVGGMGTLFTMHQFPGTFGQILESYKMGDDGRLQRSSVTAALVIAFVVGFAVGIPTALNLIFEYGDVNTGHFLGIMGVGIRDLTNSTKISRDMMALPGMILGMGVVGLLTWLRVNYVWWPLHPAGYALAWHVDVGHRYWGAILMAWIIKGIVYRYAGHEGYKIGVRIVMGILIGTIVISLLGFLIQLVISPV